MVLADISPGHFQDWSFSCRDAAGIGDQGLQNHLGGRASSCYSERPEGFDEAAAVDAPVDRQCQSGYIRPSLWGIGKHLQRYLTEVCYRFNRRFGERQSLHRLLNACASTDTITRKELLGRKIAEQSQ